MQDGPAALGVLDDAAVAFLREFSMVDETVGDLSSDDDLDSDDGDEIDEWPRRISELFGIPPATLSRVLHKAEIALDKALQEIPDAQVRYPSKHQQRQWARRVQEKEPLLDGVWGFVDGKNYRVQSPANADLRNAHYNGWLHTVLVTGTLCYGMDGTLVRGRHNLPGSWNDGETTANCK
ncbi:hypothetical protein PF004_g4351 [Phytophthora fragariae]|uniref:DDE Tnp4 domain-containing protein n=3 Tax=Phytophthora TaxID=4783 RepID=A0A6G0PIR9_9STRA|nr:hypothetical protein PF004_g4351 [Phytophthora fragariae]